MARVWGRGLLLKAPPTHFSLAVLALEALLLSLIICHKSYFGFGLIPLLVLNPFVAKAIVRNKNFTLRRSSYIYLYLNTPLTLALAADMIGRPETIGAAIAIALITVITYLLAMVILATFRAGFKVAAAISAVFYTTYACFTPLGVKPPILVGVFFVTMLVALAIYNRLLNIKVAEVNGIDLVSSFAGSWMDKASNSFDEICRKLGEETELKISIHEFVSQSSDRIATIIIPYIHPGPAKAIGSGELPTILYAELKQYHPLILHGASDHTLNMASRSDLKKVSQEIALSLEGKKEPLAPLTKIGFGKRKEDNIKISAYRINGNTLFFVSKEDSTEDLPRKIADIVTEKLDIVDRHNTLCDEKKAHYQNEELEKLVEAFEKIPVEAELTIEGVGYSNRKLEARDIAPGGVSVLVFKGPKKAAIVSIDANNLACGLNKALEEKVRSLGYETCEITTTDNHWNSGTTRRYPGYYLGGSLSKDRLLDAVVKCVVEAEKNAKPALYRKSTVSFRSIVLGDKLEEMYRALKAGRVLIFVGGVSSLIFSFILSLV